MLRTFLVFCLYHFDSKHNSSFLQILSLYIIEDWIITIMGDSKHELGTVKMFSAHPTSSPPKKNKNE